MQANGTDHKGPPASGLAQLTDRLGRPLRDLRVSVTDRCNFRCTYCMPKTIFGPTYPFLAHDDLLTFEEIERVVSAAVQLGVQKVRLTGGEPLVRREIEKLIALLAKVEGLTDLTLTTNGVALAAKAQRLRDAGLQRITVSLDSLDDAVFRSMNDVDFPVARVLDGIAAAQAAGFGTIKVNMVVKRGLNDDSIVPMAAHFRHSGIILRFIEFMDVGTTNGWQMDDVVTGAEIVDRIGSVFPLEAVARNYQGEVAARYRYRDGAGEIGVVTSVSQPFCGDCSRARLSSDGQLYTCLFASSGTDLRTALRAGASSAELTALLADTWGRRADRYSEIRGAYTRPGRKVEMSHIGG